MGVDRLSGDARKGKAMSEPMADDAIKMCMEECAEVLGDQSCVARGRLCIMDEMFRAREPKPPREVRMTSQFVEAARKISGNKRWPLRKVK